MRHRVHVRAATASAACIVLCAAAALTQGPAARASHSVVELISTGPSGDGGEFGASSFKSNSSGVNGGGDGISPDGARVIFQTGERLVPDDTDEQFDVYERAHGITRLLSSGPSGGNGGHVAWFLGASDDVTHVFFYTAERLAPEDTDDRVDIYESHAGETALVTTGPVGSDWPIRLSYGDFRISKDGEHAFFNTDQQLVATDTDGQTDVYERHGGETTLLTVGTQTEARLPYFLSSSRTSVSADGARVFIESREVLDPADGDTARDVYEFRGGHATLISTGPTDSSAWPYVISRDIELGGLSEDGKRVFFHTAQQLTADDTDADRCRITDFSGREHAIPCGDVYERSNGATTLISVEEGEPVAGHAQFEGTSPDGTHVFFRSGSAFTSEDQERLSSQCILNSCEDIYERFAATTSLVSTGPADPHRAEEYLTGSNPIFNGTTPDGSQSFFKTYVRLVPEDVDHCYDIYKRSGKTTVLISAPSRANRVCDDGIEFGGTSADGSRVFFETGIRLTTTDLDAGCMSFNDEDYTSYPIRCRDVFERHGDSTTLISTSASASHGPYQATFYGNSASGDVVLFGTGEPLVDSDHDSGCSYYYEPQGPGCPDVYVARTAPPDCSNVTASAPSLWPPNRKPRLVTLTGAVAADGSPLTARITAVSQDEPSLRDARLGPGVEQVQLSAARSPHGDGRVYRIAFTASDAAGSSCTGTVKVEVPRHKGAPAAESAPPWYDSLAP